MLHNMQSMGNTSPLLEEGQIYTAIAEIGVAVPPEDRNQSFSRPSYTTLGHMPKKHFILPQRNLLKHVHYCSVHE